MNVQQIYTVPDTCTYNICGQSAWYKAITVNPVRSITTMFCVVDTLHERRDTINSSVNSDIEKIFRGKTSAQLSALRSQINTKISGGGAVDIGELHVTYFYTFLLYNIIYSTITSLLHNLNSIHFAVAYLMSGQSADRD